MPAFFVWRRHVLVAVISDLHLGTRDKVDAFQHEDNEFLRFLKYLEGNFERIVLLGDIWETLTAPKPGMQEVELLRAQAAHPEIHRRLLRLPYRYVHGNHDLVASQIMRAPDEYRLDADGIRVVFNHGHQGDGLCMSARRLSEFGVWAGGWLRRVGMQAVYSSLASLESGRSTEADRCSVRRWALSHGATREADIVVTGHTHKAAKVHAGARLFLNSGSCAEGNISFLSLDTRADRYEVVNGY
jgi:UDP-2,3-diacylglucosamine pyrophosphatase LpxH